MKEHHDHQNLGCPILRQSHILKVDNHPISLEKLARFSYLLNKYHQLIFNMHVIMELSERLMVTDGTCHRNDELVSPKLGSGSKMETHKFVYMGAVLPQSSSKNELSQSTSPK